MDTPCGNRSEPRRREIPHERPPGLYPQGPRRRGRAMLLWAPAGLLALAVAAGVGLRGAPASTTAAPAPAKPNLVVIMADDLDTHTLETLLRLGFLPNIERYIVQRGYRFSNSFVTNSLCCPSRATYLTGRYSHNHHVLTNDPPTGSVAALDDTSTIATMLQGAGYRTAHVGKYLNYYGSNPGAPETSPENPHYVPLGWNRWEALVDPTTYSVFNYVMSVYDDRTDPVRRGRPRVHGDGPNDYQADVLGRRAASVILESRLYFPNTPLFLTVTPLAPHVERFTMALTAADGWQYEDIWRWYIRPDPKDETEKPGRWHYIFNTLPLLPQLKPSFNESDVTDKPAELQRPSMTPDDVEALTWQYRTRFAAMLAVDDLVGKVAAALGPELAKTVIVFTSDNGYLYGEHRMAEKVVAYEESIRVPLYIALPGLSGPVDLDAIVLNNDLAPTLAALGGAAPPAADGRSLAGFLAGGTPPGWRKRVLVEHWGGSGSVFDVPTYAAVRTVPGDAYPGRLYVEYYGDPANPDAVTAIELYDLRTDPYQIESKHADPSRAAEIAYLTAQLQQLKSCGMSDKPRCQDVER